MTEDSFRILLEHIRSSIETEDTEMASRSAGSEVSPEVRLAMTLRFLAGGIVHDIHQGFGVSRAEFYRSVWRVVDAINNTFPISFPLDDVEKLKELEIGFAQSRGAKSCEVSWALSMAAASGRKILETTSPTRSGTTVLARRSTPCS